METSGARPNGGLEWRLRNAEKRLDRLEEGQPAVLAERIRQLERRVDDLDRHTNRRMDDLAAGQNALQRAIVGAAVTFAGSALLFSFTVWQVFG